MTAPLSSIQPSGYAGDPSARAHVALVAAHDPATLPDQDVFAWTGKLSDRQRQEMRAEAAEALREGEDHGDWASVEALAADWQVAQKLLALPDVVATLPAGWRVSHAWYWMPQWQAREREVDDDLAAGRRGQIYESEEAFLSALDAVIERHAHL